MKAILYLLLLAVSFLPTEAVSPVRSKLEGAQQMVKTAKEEVMKAKVLEAEMMEILKNSARKNVQRVVKEAAILREETNYLQAVADDIEKKTETLLNQI